MVKDSCSTIPKVDEKKKKYTKHDLKMADRARWLYHITYQPVKKILHAVDNNILHNLPTLKEDVGMSDEIYGPSVPHLQGKNVHYKVQNMELIIVPNTPKGILDRYNNVTLCYDLMNINGIGFLNTIPRQILFSTVSMIKNWKVKNIEDGIKKFNKLYLQHGFKTTRIHADI